MRKKEIEFVVSYDVKTGKTTRHDNRFDAVRDLVKDSSLRVTEIAWKTGYNKGHVSRLRKEFLRQALYNESGMSLRDYLAAKAMQIQMANKKEMNYWAAEYSVEEMWGFCARNAYDMADAMLKERER